MRRAFALLLAALPALAAPAPDRLPAALRTSLLRVVNDPALSTGFAGAVAVAVGRRSPEDLAAGRFEVVPYDGARRPELFANLADKVFAPASNMKLVTVAAAMSRLGPEHRWITRVVAPAPPRDGVVEGLWLVGGGDPGLSSDDLDALAKKVAAAGVRRIDGGVRGDASRYVGRFPYGWAVDDLPWYYGAEVSALTVDRNLVNLVVRPGAPGEPARITSEPADAQIEVRNLTRTVAAGGANAIEFDREVDSPVMLVTGTIAADREDPFSQRMAVPSPPLYAAARFTEALRKAGVAVAQAPSAGAPPAGAAELARHESQSLGELSVRLLKYSDNLYAELFLRELGAVAGPRGSAGGGAEAVVAFLREKQISTAGLRMEDGSGLSRYNLISPRTLAGVLRAMAFSPHRQAFFEALPVAGVDGSLAARMKGTAAERRVNAKTGYISNHTGLSGYVTTVGGDVLVVSTIWSQFTSPTAESRRCHDAFFVALAGWNR